jgi:hypothetical protein
LAGLPCLANPVVGIASLFGESLALSENKEIGFPQPEGALLRGLKQPA